MMKINANNYGQQAVNEVISNRLHERLGCKNYVPYRVERVMIDGEDIPYSLNPLFTSEELEFVPAYQLVRNHKTPQNMSNYEEMILETVKYGMNEDIVREQLEYMILTDFILSNTDRHFNNFGFLYDSNLQKLVSVAPIFDTGNALFYDQDTIPVNNLLEVEVTSFLNKEVKMLGYITNKEAVNLQKLNGFAKEAEKMLKTHTNMPGKRAELIGETIQKKIEYLKLFQQGKKIWRKEKYW